MNISVYFCVKLWTIWATVSVRSPPFHKLRLYNSHSSWEDFRTCSLNISTLTLNPAWGSWYQYGGHGFHKFNFHKLKMLEKNLKNCSIVVPDKNILNTFPLYFHAKLWPPSESPVWVRKSRFSQLRINIS